jgi:bacteriocin biosynthesis cyclodehydratase domain-containing protein
VILRLDPAVPIVWRAPDVVQLGIDPVVCVFEGAAAATERLLAALAVGTPESALPVIAETAGVGERFAAALLDAVRPALLPEGAAAASEARDPRRLRIAVEGDGPAARALAAVLRGLGVTLVESVPGLGADPDDAAAGIDAAVLIGAYAIAPRRHGLWLRRDVPHLGVVFGERNVRIGPFVEPGEGPCLSCLDLELRDADEAWPIVAAQLADKRAPAESAGFAASATLRIASELLAHLQGGSRELVDQTLELRADDPGAATRVRHAPDARCGCRALPGTATADVLRLDRFRPRSSSAAGAAAHA